MRHLSESGVGLPARIRLPATPLRAPEIRLDRLGNASRPLIFPDPRHADPRFPFATIWPDLLELSGRRRVLQNRFCTDV